MQKKISVEFLGTPGSGKSFYFFKLQKELEKKRFKTFNYLNLFLKYYPFNISTFQSIKFEIKLRLNQSRFYLFKYINTVFDKFFSFDDEINKIIRKKKIKIFFKQYFKFLKDAYPDNNDLLSKHLKWLRNEISSIEVFKKLKEKQIILINSEGINQRISRLQLNNFNYKNLRNLNYKNFESDIVVLIDTSINKCKKRLLARNEKRISLEELTKFDQTCKKIFKLSKKKKFIIKKNKDLNKVIKQINEYFTY